MSVNMPLNKEKSSQPTNCKVENDNENLDLGNRLIQKRQAFFDGIRFHLATRFLVVSIKCVVKSTG